MLFLGSRYQLFSILLCLGLTTADPYNDTQARDIMVYASAAYCPKGKVESWKMEGDCATRTSNFLDITSFEATPPDVKYTRQYFGLMGVDYGRKWVVASFKGTNGSMADFATDLSGGYFSSDCIIDSVNIGKVHAGFCNYYKYLDEAGFSQSLVKLAAKHPDFPVIVTGHSLGAAAAMVASVFLEIKYKLDVTIYTYGQPRVGDHNFSKTVSNYVKDSWRVVHAKDMIAHEPFCCAIFGECHEISTCPYHTDHEIWYEGGMAVGSPYVQCQGPEDSNCNNWVDLSVDDHLNYFDIELAAYCCYEDL
mmetsp:Transcript_26449/g.31261  ORF Transcript_26449/g.31261 Transcript_26449/m.31261 type:complete len:306 (+) Transcript_26449:13-930(+)